MQMVVVTVLFYLSFAIGQSDTSIFKKGNTWLYSVSNHEYEVTEYACFIGTTKYSIDSVMVVKDTIKVAFTQRDSGTRCNPPRQNVVTESKAAYFYLIGDFAYTAYAYTPFMPAMGSDFKGQIFKVKYLKDTLKLNVYNAKNLLFIDTLSYKYLERVGMATYYRRLDAGTFYTTDSYNLISYNGRKYFPDSIFVLEDVTGVKLNKSILPGGSSVKLLQGLLKYNNAIFDAKGRFIQNESELKTHKK